MNNNHLTSETKPGKKVWVAPSFERIAIKSKTLPGINSLAGLAS